MRRAADSADCIKNGARRITIALIESNSFEDVLSPITSRYSPEQGLWDLRDNLAAVRGPPARLSRAAAESLLRTYEDDM